MTTEGTADTVRALLGAATITVSDTEFLDLVRIYPALRTQADGLYRPELESVDPALSFDPTAD